MAARSVVTVPLPELAACGDCATAVHDRLRDQPGVAFVEIDRTRGEARLELDASEFGAAQVAAFVRALVAGAAGAAPLHAGHAPPPAAASDAHDHDGHDHDHGPGGHAHDLRELARHNRRRLVLAASIGAVVVLVQLVGGLWSGSLVLLSDAAHMGTDVAAVLLAAWAAHIAARPPTPRKSFGWQRTEIVAAFVNAVGLWLVSAVFVVEAVRRLDDPPEVNGAIVLGVGAVSLVANVGLAAMLHGGAKKSLNVRSAYVHVLSDVLGSLAALAAGAAILLYGWTWADPVLTLVITALIIAFTWRLTRQTLHILLEGTPEETDTDALRRDMLGVEGVRDVHDLHVWSLTTGVHSMSAHVVVADATRGPDVARRVRQVLVGTHDLRHVTLEIEAEGQPCEACG